MIKTSLYSIIILAVVLMSCEGGSNNTKEAQGTIHFEIKYIKNKTNVPSFILPKIMVMKFNKRYAKTSIDAFGFSLGYIYDLKKNTNYTLLQILEHKFYHKSENNEYPCGFDQLSNMEITPLPDTLSLGGFLCNKARAVLPIGVADTFDIYYSKEFGMENPNRTLPYKAIDGMLMQFNVILDKIEMQFKAKKVKYQEISKDEFNIPDEYVLIPRDKMNNYITELLDK